GDLSDAHFLRGAPANPMMVDSLDYLTGFPASGTVYTFSQLTVGLDEDQVVDLQIYPNPASDRVQIQSEMPISEFRIVDISGREVLSGEVVNSTIELPSLSSGAYLLQLGHQGKWVNRRLMIE
ncbi:MAG: T9SS type A sorting domain-containing protein, partial [Bacteroidota bacterium]|nr:T9SS type A sorting domain-containing protein [Bacteroidota bacterium]MDX5505864.1 T9SS type A sorting domain-containing protein [Bacteroidota bacterium]